MSYITGPDVVKYACTCGLLKPITHLYFCRYCTQIRCSFCVCHEIDSNFCGKCSENIPSSEAKLKKNRCGNCYVCPSCQQDLSTRIASKGSANPEEAKSTPKKMYYLLCQFCRWSSRDVGIPDQSTVTGGWPKRENVHANRLQELLDSYKAIILASKKHQQDKDKKKRVKCLSYTDRTGVTTAAIRKRLGLPADMTNPMLKNKPKDPDPAKAKSEVEELPESIFTEPLNLTEVMTIEQRLLQTEQQPTIVDKLFPVHKQLSIKRSLRCRSCEHNVSKPEYNPSSVKFKIQLFAYYIIPEIRIVTVEPLRAGKTSELIIKFTNPTQHQTTITFFELNLNEVEPQIAEEVAEVAENFEQNLYLQEKQQLSLPSLGSLSQPNSLLSSRTPSITVKPRLIKQELNSKVAIPTSSFILLPRDDAAEYDDSGDSHNIQDDPNLVKWRKSNKAFIRLAVTPNGDLPLNSEVVCGFVMQHIYTNTITSKVENKEPQQYNHKVKVFLNLGNSVGCD
nr:unnamed protein product [Callosobruchus chinensis]